MKRILVCGSRDWADRKAIRLVLEQAVSLYGEITIIQGACRGADLIAHEIALELEQISISVPARWKLHGKKAGPIRNSYMLQKGRPDLVLAFHEDILTGRGTSHMISIAKDAGVPTILIDGSNLAGFSLEETLNAQIQPDE